MNSELEETATLADLGPVLILRGGEHVRLRSVDFPVALKALLPLVVDVVDPAALAGRMIDGAFSAPTTKGENELTETVDGDASVDQILAEEHAALQEEARAAAEQRAALDELRAAERAEDERRNKDAGPRMNRAWRVFSSPARRRHDWAKAQDVRLMQCHCQSLQAESEQRAREAATAAAESVRQEFIEHRQRIERAFHAGRTDWKETR